MQKQGITTKIKRFIPVLLLSLTLLFCLTTVSAADNNTIYVNDTGGNDSWDGTSWATAKLSIKNATGTINTNGTIHIANGQYTGENNTNIIISKNMSIIGESQTGTIINGTDTAGIFKILPGLNVTIKNLTLTKGTGFYDTTAKAGYRGGAIYNQGNLNIENCMFTCNNAGIWGGAISTESSGSNSATLTAKNCIFTNSTSGNQCSGGAIFIDGSSGSANTLDNCTFLNNTASYNGGAVYVGYTTLNVANCTFNGNIAKGGGSAIFSYYVKSNVESCTFSDNIAYGQSVLWDGGTIRNEGNTLTAHFNRFYNNRALPGNVIYNKNGQVDAENNWWGTNIPNTNWGSFISGFNHPNWWIYMNLTADPSNILYGGNSTLTADFNYLYNGTDITVLDPLNGHIPDGSPVSFTTTLGNIDPAFTTTVNGVAKSIFTPITVGSVTINAKMDDQTCPLTFTVGKGIPNVSVAEVHNFAGQTVNLIANVKDQNNNPVNQGQVTFKVDNDDLGTVNVINGIARIDNWLIPASWSAGNYTILVNYIENNNYTASSGTGNLTVDKTPTNLTIDNISGNKGKTVTLKANLKDYYGTPINNKTVEFYVNNVKVGENTTDTTGLAAFNYNIDLIGGTYNITAKFIGDTEYLASNDNGTLKVNQSSVYVLTTASKTNPTVGETITLNFKLGNNGPDPADDVVFTYVIPDGMEFVSLETEPGYPEAVYNPETRTITWNLGTVPKLDPWLKLNVKVLKSGIFNVNPAVITSVYDPALGSNIQFVTINAVQAASAASTVTSTTRSIGMQETGLPIPLLVLAILMVLGGSLVPKRK